MHSAHDPYDPAVVARLLDTLVQDQLDGNERTPEEYGELFPGYEAMVVREIAALRADEGEETWEVGGYPILEEIGSGGQGVVYLAQDPLLPRRVALKVLRGFVAPAPGTFLRFQREVDVTAGIEHPGICPVYAVGLEGGAPWIAMRHIEGEDLRHRIAAEKKAGEVPRTRADIEERCRLVAQVADAIEAAHANGVVHRDLKPGNVIVQPDGQPVVLDFGLARTEDSTLTATGDALGSPAYMAPEQCRGDATVDARADVWALGVLLYELLSHERPFHGSTNATLMAAIEREEAPGVRSRNAAVPRDVEVILATALEKDLGRRYASAAELAADLRRFLAKEPIAARPAGVLLRLTRWAQRKPAQAIGLAAGIAVAALTGLLALSEGENRANELEDAARAAHRQVTEGYFEIAGGNPDAARRTFEDVGPELAGSPEHVVGQALALYDLQRASEAEAVLSDALDAGGHASLELVRRYVLDDDVATRGAMLPDDEVTALVRGAIAWHRGHRGDAAGFDDAADHFLHAAGLVEDSSLLYALLAVDAGDRAGRDDVRGRRSELLLAHWPKSAAVALVVEGDAKRASELSPGFVSARQELSRQYLRDYAWDQAIEELETLIAHEPADVELRRELAETLLAYAAEEGAKGDGNALLAQAHATLTGAAALDPDDPATQALLAAAGANGAVSRVDLHGDLTLSDDRAGDGSSVDYLEITALPGELIRVSMSSEDFEPYVLVLVEDADEHKRVLAADQIRGRDAVQVRFEMPAQGRCFLLANAVNEEGSGSYDLLIEYEGRLDFASPDDANGKRALLVGISDYPVGSTYDLPAGVDDVAMMRDVLIEHYGFTDDEVVVLTEERATRRNVILGFREHLASAGEDGVALFYFSGHGTRLRQRGTEDIEADNRDDALVLTDGLMLDDEIAILIDGLSARNALVVLDACHSGSGSMLAGNVWEKEILEDDLPAEFGLPTVKLTAADREPHEQGLPGDEPPDPTDHVLLASSLEHQTSLAYGVGGLSTEHAASLFTYCLTLAMRKAEPDASFEDLRRQAQRYMQNPLSQGGHEQDVRVRGTRAGESAAAYLEPRP